MNRRKSNITREANAPIDCHVIDWFFTTNGAGAPVDLSATVESVTSGTIGGVDGYRVRLREPAPLDNIIQFDIENTVDPGAADLTSHYYTGFTGNGTAGVSGLADPDFEFDVLAESGGVVALAQSVRISGQLVIDTAPNSTINAHGG